MNIAFVFKFLIRIAVDLNVEYWIAFLRNNRWMKQTVGCVELKTEPTSKLNKLTIHTNESNQFIIPNVFLYFFYYLFLIRYWCSVVCVLNIHPKPAPSFVAFRIFPSYPYHTFDDIDDDWNRNIQNKTIMIIILKQFRNRARVGKLFECFYYYGPTAAHMCEYQTIPMTRIAIRWTIATAH